MNPSILCGGKIEHSELIIKETNELRTWVRLIKKNGWNFISFVLSSIVQPGPPVWPMSVHHWEGQVLKWLPLEASRVFDEDTHCLCPGGSPAGFQHQTCILPWCQNPWCIHMCSAACDHNLNHVKEEMATLPAPSISKFWPYNHHGSWIS